MSEFESSEKPFNQLPHTKRYRGGTPVYEQRLLLNVQVCNFIKSQLNNNSSNIEQKCLTMASNMCCILFIKGYLWDKTKLNIVIVLNNKNSHIKQ